MAKLVFLVVPVAGLAIACAHRSSVQALPEPAEVGAYVAEHWQADLSERFGRLAGRPRQSSRLVSVENVRCSHSWRGSVAACTYDVTAAFAGGEIVTEQLSSEFERQADMSLKEVIIVWHERKR